MALAPTVAAIRAAIITQVKAALNPGTPGNVTTVHDRRRFWRDASKFNSVFRRVSPDLLPGKVNGWMIFRTATEEVETDERWRFYGLHTFELHGYMGVQDEDATSDERAFQDQIEVIRGNCRLSAAIFGNMERVVPAVQVAEAAVPVTIGEVTAWYSRLTLRAEGIEVKTL